MYFLNLLLIVLTILAYISPFVNPADTWFFSFFGLGYPILLIANVFFIFFWLLTKPVYAIASVLIIALGYKALIKTVGLNAPANTESGLKIMSYNIGHTKYLFDLENSENRTFEFSEFIQKEAPDIICLQERTRRHLPLYEDIFEGYHLYPDKFIGTAIYSKLPILESGNLYFDTNAHNATWIDVEYNFKRIRIYCIHLSSNKLKKFSEKISDVWDDGFFILDKYNLHAVKRTEQIEKILEHARKSPYPVVMTGDFNDIPQSYMYRLITREYNDAFVEKGTGLVRTHNIPLPGLRIDYVFHSESLNVNKLEVLKVEFSDHYPLLSFIE